MPSLRSFYSLVMLTSNKSERDCNFQFQVFDNSTIFVMLTFKNPKRETPSYQKMQVTHSTGVVSLGVCGRPNFSKWGGGIMGCTHKNHMVVHMAARPARYATVAFVGLGNFRSLQTHNTESYKPISLPSGSSRARNVHVLIN